MTMTAPYLVFALFMIPGRYIAIAGFFYFLFYYLKREKWHYLKIQKNFPSPRIIKSEIIYSLITMTIYSIIAFIIFKMYWMDYTLLYINISDKGVLYFILSTILIIIFHDLYFYVTHRIMHHRSIYHFVHKVHHISVNPTPWAAFSFHPIEALVSIIWIPFIIMLIPFHIFSLAIWALYMMLFNVIGHLGYEFFPKRFADSFIGSIFFTSLFHNLHHKTHSSNYGLYFILWDRLFSTINNSYKNIYNEFQNDISSHMRHNVSE